MAGISVVTMLFQSIGSGAVECNTDMNGKGTRLGISLSPRSGLVVGKRDRGCQLIRKCDFYLGDKGPRNSTSWRVDTIEIDQERLLIRLY